MHKFLKNSPTKPKNDQIRPGDLEGSSSKIHYFYILSLKCLHNALLMHESRPKIRFQAQFIGYMVQKLTKIVVLSLISDKKSI